MVMITCLYHYLSWNKNNFAVSMKQKTTMTKLQNAGNHRAIEKMNETKTIETDGLTDRQTERRIKLNLLFFVYDHVRMMMNL